MISKADTLNLITEDWGDIFKVIFMVLLFLPK